MSIEIIRSLPLAILYAYAQQCRIHPIAISNSISLTTNRYEQYNSSNFRFYFSHFSFYLIAMSHELIALVTAPNKEEASRIAGLIVAERLAACVNIVNGIESVYRWEGEVTRDTETLMIIKTTDEKYQALERRIKELHSYTTPEIIAFSIERGSEQYLGWLRESVSEE